ncbi:MAG: DUF192 domain-containing protein [Terracidiphilus sp.]|jgi:uncharacterized membrane protein (UPF0127 family)
MNVLSRIFGRPRNGITQARPPTPEARLQVTNLTRHTVLATNLEVANSGSTRSKGLLGRARLAPGEGLWILPCEAVHTFFMRFSIDLVYLDRKNRIRKICDAVPPWRLSACLTAHSVLELAPGTIRDTQTQPGDQVEFSPASLLHHGSQSPTTQL